MYLCDCLLYQCFEVARKMNSELLESVKEMNTVGHTCSLLVLFHIPLYQTSPSSTFSSFHTSPLSSPSPPPTLPPLTPQTKKSYCNSKLEKVCEELGESDGER